jgi:hypothetical protein
VKVFNKQGDTLEVNMRFAVEGDASNITNLIIKQHGGCYWSDMLTNIDFVRAAIKSGNMRIALIELSNDCLAGTTGIKKFKGAIELNMLIVKPEYRGFAFGKLLYLFLVEKGIFENSASIYTRCMTLDTASQRICLSMGHSFTGLILNYHRFDYNAEHLSGTPLPYKGSLVISCLLNDKKDAGNIYAPLQHTAFIEEVYNELSARFTLVGEKAVVEQERPPLSCCEIVFQEKQQYCEMIFTNIGLDAEKQIAGALEHCGKWDGGSLNIFVNLNDPACPALYYHLEKSGFVFTGIQPLTFAGEYMILYYAPGLRVDFERIIVTPEFSGKFAYIRALFGKAGI